MFLTDNKKYYDQAVLLSNMGRTDRLATFWCDSLGYEYQMANVTAALIRAQVERIEELVEKKRKIWGWYRKHFPVLEEHKGDRANYCYPALLLQGKANRNKIVDKLFTYNIHARCAFPQMSRFPMYTARYANTVAAEVAKYGINLPSAANLTKQDIEYVCKKLKELL